MKKSSVYRMQRFFVFSDSVLCFGKVHQNPTSNIVWERQLEWFKNSPQYRTLDTIDGLPMEVEWNIFQGFTTLELVREVQKFMGKMEKHHNSKDELSSCRCSMTSFGDLQTMNGNALLTPHLWLYLRKDFQQDVGHASDLGSEIKWFSTNKERPGGKLDRVAELMMIKFGESGHQVFPNHESIVRGTLKRKGGGKLSIHFWADGDTVETVFRTIISVYHLSICGAVSDLCDEYSICQTSTMRPRIGRAIWPTFRASNLLIMTPRLSIEILAQENLLQKHKERVWKLPQPDQLTKIWTDAGFLTTVEVGQYFMTKDTEEFSQFTESVVCPECTLPRDEKSFDPKGWIRGNTKIGPRIGSHNSYLQGKYGVEIRIESGNKDHSHSRVRI